MEAVQIAGFSEDEANTLFGKIEQETIEGLGITLRPPLEVRTDFTKTHAELSERL